MIKAQDVTADTVTLKFPYGQTLELTHKRGELGMSASIRIKMSSRRRGRPVRHYLILTDDTRILHTGGPK